MACHHVDQELPIELSRWRPHTNSTIGNMENTWFSLLNRLLFDFRNRNLWRIIKLFQEL
ncbi:unnamed protein product [Hymenolepis diminuta]|uniref:Uncharacterized protein n=1 Tax=Hymenolepis diminuta TaxID=6216 RepID=A0A564XWN0_HYMDI|nr:unnamed protein product [Hymenolepis diminuta]